MAMNFALNQLLKITPIVNGTASAPATIKLTDHNRSQMQISTETIEQSSRMANGTMRKYVVSSKKGFSLSWEKLPSLSTKTVDGFSGADDITSFYNAYFQYPIKLDVVYGTGTASVTYNVFFNEFSKDLIQRSTVYDLYNLSLSWTEI